MSSETWAEILFQKFIHKFSDKLATKSADGAESDVGSTADVVN